MSELGDFVDAPTGFLGHAELAFAECGFHIFGSAAVQRNFEIVDECGTVHGDAGNVAFVDQVNQDGRETHLDNMATDAPEDGPAALARPVNRTSEIVQILSRQNFRQRIEEFCEGSAAGCGKREIMRGDFALTRGEGISPNTAKRYRLDGINAHRGVITVRGKAAGTQAGANSSKARLKTLWGHRWFARRKRYSCARRALAPAPYRISLCAPRVPEFPARRCARRPGRLRGQDR